MTAIRLMEERINNVINTRSFHLSLENNGLALIDFQCHWTRSNGDFSKLQKAYQDAILDGEKELATGVAV